MTKNSKSWIVQLSKLKQYWKWLNKHQAFKRTKRCITFQILHITHVYAWFKSQNQLTQYLLYIKYYTSQHKLSICQTVILKKYSSSFDTPQFHAPPWAVWDLLCQAGPVLCILLFLPLLNIRISKGCEFLFFCELLIKNSQAQINIHSSTHRK